MDANQWEEVQTLFAKVCEMSPQERTETLRDIGKTQPELVSEVEGLLFFHDRSEDFLEDSAVNQVVQVMEKKGTFAEAPFPAFEGPYEILSLLGKGGMGSVYVAQQLAPVERKVALKVINYGRDQTNFIDRFRYEHQALALMNHPNVAHVYDAGSTADGRPFFTMEYVDGTAVTEYCDREHLSLEARLRLFLQICEGIQHAHRKGVIHRDLKPTNIMVTLQSGAPVPKIIDFGIAKIINRATTLEERKTMFGTLLGTPAYMSPEQAEGRDMDTGTDVYALGMLLYELLVGGLPYDAKAYEITHPTDVLRLVLDMDPPRPSERLAQIEGKARNAGSRGSNKNLAKVLKGDLDWVIMKALEKERQRRYGSVAELALDVERFLDQKPVTACPPAKSYLVKKFFRRHKTGAISALLVGVALILGIAGLAYGMFEAQKAKDEALIEADKATNLADFLKDILSNADPRTLDPREELRALVDAAAFRMSTLAKQPATEAEFRIALGGVYSAWGDYEKARDQFEKALEIRKKLYPPTHPDLLMARQVLAYSLMRLENREEAERELREVVDLCRENLGEDHAQTLLAMRRLADTLGKKSRAEAVALYERVLAAQQKSLGGSDLDTLTTMKNLADVLIEVGRYGDAEQYLREVLRQREALLPPNHPHILSTLESLVLALYYQGNSETALPLARSLYDRATLKLGTEHIQTAKAAGFLGMVLGSLGHFAEAGEMLEIALGGLKQLRGPDHPDTLNAQNNLAEHYLSVGNFVKAEAIKQNEIAIRSAKESLDKDFWIANLTLGEIYYGQGRYAEAETLLCRVYDGLLGTVPPNHSFVAYTHGMIGGCLMEMGRYEAAESMLKQSLSDLQKRKSGLVSKIEEMLHLCEWYRDQAQEGSVN